jgi:hypothetical protein
MQAAEVESFQIEGFFLSHRFASRLSGRAGETVLLVRDIFALRQANHNIHRAVAQAAGGQLTSPRSIFSPPASLTPHLFSLTGSFRPSLDKPAQLP